MTAQAPSSGHSENIEVLSCAAGQPSLVLSPISETAAKVLGDAFAAIDPWARYPYPASALTIYFATVEPQAPRYAIHAADKLVGAIGLRLNWLHGPYIQFLGLLSGQQGLGLGGRLLSWCEESARSRGARNLWVAASDFNGRQSTQSVAGLPNMCGNSLNVEQDFRHCSRTNFHQGERNTWRFCHLLT